MEAKFSFLVVIVSLLCSIQFANGIPPRPLHRIEMENLDECDMCKDLVSVIEKHAGSDSLNSKLAHHCQTRTTLQAECKKLVDEFGIKFIEGVKAKETAENLCRTSRSCRIEDPRINRLKKRLGPNFSKGLHRDMEM